jgi:hypothetical protein
MSVYIFTEMLDVLRLRTRNKNKPQYFPLEIQGYYKNIKSLRQEDRRCECMSGICVAL